MHKRLLWLSLALVWPALGAERVFDLSSARLDGPPPGFRSLLAGTGQPGVWKVIMDETPMQLGSSNLSIPVHHPVIAQVSQDPTEERFPLLVFDGDEYADFTMTTRFKIIGGESNQMAGVVFRVKDEKNFSVFRASALGRNVRFYKVVNGERANAVNADVDIPTNVWQDLSVECAGNHISCRLNGRQVFPVLTDTDSKTASGKIGFFTKSDTLANFSDLKLTYRPKVMPAVALVHDTVNKNKRLVGLKIFVMDEKSEPQLVASKDDADVGKGKNGGLPEKDALMRGTTYYGKGVGTCAVVMPLRDRNGEPIAAVRVTLSSVLGQTQDNALIRALPIVKDMQERVQSLEDLVQ